MVSEDFMQALLDLCGALLNPHDPLTLDALVRQFRADESCGFIYALRMIMSCEIQVIISESYGADLVSQWAYGRGGWFVFALRMIMSCEIQVIINSIQSQRVE
jgi:hypothetical protein